MICQYSLEAQRHWPAQELRCLVFAIALCLDGRARLCRSGHGRPARREAHDSSLTRSEGSLERRAGGMGREAARKKWIGALQLASAVMRWHSRLRRCLHPRATSRLLSAARAVCASGDVREEMVELTFTVPVAIDVAMYSAEASVGCPSCKLARHLATSCDGGCNRHGIADLLIHRTTAIAEMLRPSRALAADHCHVTWRRRTTHQSRCSLFDENPGDGLVAHARQPVKARFLCRGLWWLRGSRGVTEPTSEEDADGEQLLG